MIEHLLVLDYNPRLYIREVSIPAWNRAIILSDDNGKSYSVAPKSYIVNMALESPMSLMLAVRAVRRRAQIEKRVIHLFKEKDFLGEFQEDVAGFFFRNGTEEEIDAELIARIAGNLRASSCKDEEIRELVLMNAPDVIEKYGVPFLVESLLFF